MGGSGGKRCVFVRAGRPVRRNSIVVYTDFSSVRSVGTVYGLP